MLEFVSARNKAREVSRILEEQGKLGRHEKSMILEAFLAIEKANSIIKTLERKTKDKECN